MIKIAYISRVAVPNRVAQAEQILSAVRPRKEHAGEHNQNHAKI